MFKFFKKIFIVLFLIIFNVNISATYPAFNHISDPSLLPMTFWYNSSAVTFSDLTDFLTDINFNLIYFSDYEYFHQIGLVRANNHIIVTTKEHIDDINITKLVPFENPYLQFLINALKESNRLERFISDFQIKQYNLVQNTVGYEIKEQPI